MRPVNSLYSQIFPWRPEIGGSFILEDKYNSLQSDDSFHDFLFSTPPSKSLQTFGPFYYYSLQSPYSPTVWMAVEKETFGLL